MFTVEGGDRTMHLHGQVLDDYVTRDLPPQTLDAIDQHVSNCLFCAHTLASGTAASTGWERRGLLGRLVRD
jgi:hypothetical protein